MARKRGKWTGGHVPLGYDLVDGCLVINEEEAARVRQIFEWYLEGHSLHGIVAQCEGLGWRNKEWAASEAAGSVVARDDSAWDKLTITWALLLDQSCAVSKVSA